MFLGKGVLNKKQIYKGRPMPKCDLSKVEISCKAAVYGLLQDGFNIFTFLIDPIIYFYLHVVFNDFNNLVGCNES